MLATLSTSVSIIDCVKKLQSDMQPGLDPARSGRRGALPAIIVFKYLSYVSVLVMCVT